MNWPRTGIRRKRAFPPGGQVCYPDQDPRSHYSGRDAVVHGINPVGFLRTLGHDVVFISPQYEFTVSAASRRQMALQ